MNNGGTWFITYNGAVPAPTIVVPTGHESVNRVRNLIGKGYKMSPFSVDSTVSTGPRRYLKKAPKPTKAPKAPEVPAPPLPPVVPPPVAEPVGPFNPYPSPFASESDIAPCVSGNGRHGRPISVHLHGSASLSGFDGWADDETCRDEVSSFSNLPSYVNKIRVDVLYCASVHHATHTDIRLPKILTLL